MRQRRQNVINFLNSVIAQIIEMKVQEFKKQRGIANNKSWFDLYDTGCKFDRRNLYTGNEDEEVKR